MARHSSSSTGYRFAPAQATTGNHGRMRNDPREPVPIASHNHGRPLATSGSPVPTTSTRAKKLLYVYSSGDASTIYTDE